MIWHNMTVKDTIVKLSTDKTTGLLAEDARIRLIDYGKNALVEKRKPSIIHHFFAQFKDFMILVLLGAAGISFISSYLRGENEYADSIIILSIISLNAILGVIQENKAEKSLEALKKMATPTSKVIRNSALIHISTEDLVPGDIVHLEPGDFVSADCRLIKTSNLKVEEASLTGESLAVEKDAHVILKEKATLGDRKNMVFSSSVVSYGKATAVVVETGMNTEVGKIAKMIMSDDAPETPLQRKLSQTGKQLGIGAMIICVVIFVIGILHKISYFEMFMTSVSLAVAAIPEGLPAIVTIMLAIGVQRMVKKNAIIRRLPAVETLGSANVICSDKTGTLTQNKMKVTEVSDGLKTLKMLSPETKEILLYGTICNDCVVNVSDNGINVAGDPTETSIVNAYYDLAGEIKEAAKYRRIADIPFDSSRKLMSTINETKSGRYMSITKGAPDFLISKCDYYIKDGVKMQLNKYIRNAILSHNSKMADKALRVLGVAYKDLHSLPSKYSAQSVESGLTFLGLIGMIDPPRDEVKGAVAICKRAGIKPVMITGDHILTATAIAKKIGIMSIGDLAMTGEQLEEIPQERLCNIIRDYSVFARVSPTHKVRIVKAFQANGDVVAMTGDGVNDAPALKAADIGCAMGITGTDVAKGAADMILTDDNFTTIVHAIKEGRGIYSNIRKSAHFLISSNIGEIITIMIGIIMGWPSPLLAIQLLWVNLVTDSLPALALGLDPADESIMHEKPFSSKKSLFSNGLAATIAFEGCMIGMLSLIAFAIGKTYFDTTDVPVVGRTMAFAVLSISQLFHSFNMRSDKSLFTVDLSTNNYLFGAFLIGLTLQFIVISIAPLAVIFKVVPLNFAQWRIVALLSFMPIILVEIEKYVLSLADRDRAASVSVRKGRVFGG